MRILALFPVESIRSDGVRQNVFEEKFGCERPAVVNYGLTVQPVPAVQLNTNFDVLITSQLPASQPASNFEQLWINLFLFVHQLNTGKFRHNTRWNMEEFTFLNVVKIRYITRYKYLHTSTACLQSPDIAVNRTLTGDLGNRTSPSASPGSSPSQLTWLPIR